MAHEDLPALDYERINTDVVGCVPSMGLSLAVASFAVLWNRPPLSQQERLVQLYAADEPMSCKEQLHLHYWLNALCCYSLLLFPLRSRGWRESCDVFPRFARITVSCCIRECFTITTISNLATITSTRFDGQKMVSLYTNPFPVSYCLLCYCVSAMANHGAAFFCKQPDVKKNAKL